MEGQRHREALEQLRVVVGVWMKAIRARRGGGQQTPGMLALLAPSGLFGIDTFAPGTRAVAIVSENSFVLIR